MISTLGVVSSGTGKTRGGMRVEAKQAGGLQYSDDGSLWMMAMNPNLRTKLETQYPHYMSCNIIAIL